MKRYFKNNNVLIRKTSYFQNKVCAPRQIGKVDSLRKELCPFRNSPSFPFLSFLLRTAREHRSARHRSASLHTVGFALPRRSASLHTSPHGWYCSRLFRSAAELLGPLAKNSRSWEGATLRFHCSRSPPPQERERRGRLISLPSTKEASASAVSTAGPLLASHAMATDIAQAGLHLESKIMPQLQSRLPP